MKKIVDYYICQYHNSSGFVSSVKERIKEGFQPYGSAFVDEGVYFQPMVRYETEEDILLAGAI